MDSEDKAFKTLQALGAVAPNHHLIDFVTLRHTATLINIEQLFASPKDTRLMCYNLADNFLRKNITAVVAPRGPEMVMAHWIAHRIGHLTNKTVICPSVEIERPEAEDDLTLPGHNILLVKGVIRPGSPKTKSLIGKVNLSGGSIIGLTTIWNCAGVTAPDLKIPEIFPLINIPLQSWVPSECPMCR